MTGIVVDPANSNHAWISYDGYSCYYPSTPGHVFEVSYDPVTPTATFTDRSYRPGRPSDQRCRARQRDRGSLFVQRFWRLSLAGGFDRMETRGKGNAERRSPGLNDCAQCALALCSHARPRRLGAATPITGEARARATRERAEAELAELRSRVTPLQTEINQLTRQFWVTKDLVKANKYDLSASRYRQIELDEEF